MHLTDHRFTALTETRARNPERIHEHASERRRRELLGEDGKLVIIAADHPARSIIGVGSDPTAMGDRRQLLERTVTALRRPGVDGVLATPDIVEDLLLLDELHDKIVIGSMNRGGLTGAAWELDDRFTGYDAEHLDALGLDGGKMLLRLDYDDPATLPTIEACARAVTELADRQLLALVEPLPVARTADGKLTISTANEDLVRSVSVASALGATSAYTWLKLPAPANPAAMMAATTMPALLLGGDPGADAAAVRAAWNAAMAVPQVRGLVAGRSLLFPTDDEVERAVDAAVEIVHGGAA